MFDRYADTPGANCSVKMIESDGNADGVKKAEGLKIKVRLTEAQARERLRGYKPVAKIAIASLY